MADEYETEDAPETPEVPVREPVRKPIFRALGIVLVSLALILAVYGLVAYSAWQRGQSLRDENARLALQQELAEQLELARSDVDQGSLTLARRRLEWVLARDGGNQEALSLQATVEAVQAERLTPTPSPTPRPTAAAEEPSPTDTSEAAIGLADLAALMAAEDWAEAVSAIPAYQARFPGYRRMETDAMLYEAYINLGLSYVNGERVELGLFYLEQAEKLGDLPLEVEDQRTWADLYLLGIGSFGVNWSISIAYFRDLCAAAPFFHDACDRLFRALVAHGDQLAAAGDYCPSADRYREALQWDGGETLNGKRDRAVEGCRQATPTPTPTSVTSDTITGTIPLQATPTEP